MLNGSIDLTFYLRDEIVSRMRRYDEMIMAAAREADEDVSMVELPSQSFELEDTVSEADFLSDDWLLDHWINDSEYVNNWLYGFLEGLKDRNEIN